jgi:hypothetical protein
LKKRYPALARNFVYIFTFLVAATVLSYCGSGVPGVDNSNESPNTYFSTMRSMVIEINYEKGAEPFVGAGDARVDVWDIFGDNMKAVFRGRNSVPSISFPHTLEQMTVIPAQNKQSWTISDIQTLAEQQRRTASTETVGDFYIVFLNGYYEAGGSVDKDILGVNLGGTPIVAIFKPVVLAASNGEHEYVAKFIEQTTLIHEMGHALGMVNGGLPMAVPHQDVANGAHCTNKECVMYWENEGGMAVNKFVKKMKSSPNKSRNDIVWGAECLADSKSFSP